MDYTKWLKVYNERLKIYIVALFLLCYDYYGAVRGYLFVCICIDGVCTLSVFVCKVSAFVCSLSADTRFFMCYH